MTQILLTAAAVALAPVVVGELLAWFPWLAERLLTRAAALLPPAERDRWLNEWLAEMDAKPGTGISKLVFALSVSGGAAVMAWERRERQQKTTVKRQTLPIVRDDELMKFGFLLLIALLLYQYTRQHQQHRETEKNPPRLDTLEALSSRSLTLEPATVIPPLTADAIVRHDGENGPSYTLIEYKSSTRRSGPGRTPS